MTVNSSNGVSRLHHSLCKERLFQYPIYLQDNEDITLCLGDGAILNSFIITLTTENNKKTTKTEIHVLLSNLVSEIRNPSFWSLPSYNPVLLIKNTIKPMFT